MRIAVDAMGGDFAPDEIVRGAVLLASEIGFADEIILVGDQPKIEAALQKTAWSGAGISIRHAGEVIAMDEHPAQAIRKKRNSSVVVCGQMVKNREVDATISAGNTGAAMAVATLNIGRIERPAIATILPTQLGNCLLLDAGANVDCSPVNLLQFALMGAVYAKHALGIPDPTIGLLNIGAEESKGNELTKETYALLKKSHLRFYGNVEGKDVYDHVTDVIVCDGFVGNVALKTSEGLAEMMLSIIKENMIY
jgi:glycerol-3-phosphate acyltransferase PlsX